MESQFLNQKLGLLPNSPINFQHVECLRLHPKRQEEVSFRFQASRCQFALSVHAHRAQAEHLGPFVRILNNRLQMVALHHLSLGVGAQGKHHFANQLAGLLAVVISRCHETSVDVVLELLELFQSPFLLLFVPDFEEDAHILVPFDSVSRLLAPKVEDFGTDAVLHLVADLFLKSSVVLLLEPVGLECVEQVLQEEIFTAG